MKELTFQTPAGLYCRIFFKTLSPSTPSVTILPCHGRSSSRVKGLINSAHPRSPLDNTPCLKQTATNLCSMWCGRTGGILKMLCSLCPPRSGSKTLWLKPAHHWMGWQSGLTVPPRMFLGFQVPNKYSWNEEFQCLWLLNPLTTPLRKKQWKKI